MLYSDLYLKRRNNLSVILSVILGISIMSIFLYSFTRSGLPLTRASSDTVVKHEPVNVTAHQVGIFWQTEDPQTGWILYGTSGQNLSQTGLDEQDVGSKKEKRKLHYAVLKNLQPDTMYYYKIVSNNRLISASDSESFYVKTSRNYTLTSPTKPAYGKVILTNNEPAVGAFVMLTYANSYPFLALSKSTGEWLIPLQYAVNKTDNRILTFSEGERVQIDILYDEVKSTIKATIKNSSPIPKTVVVGQNYDFLSDVGNVLPASTKRVFDKEYDVEVQYPVDGAVIPGSQPLIRGKGVPGNLVVANINTQPVYSSKTIVDDKGSWKISVPPSTRPGIYHVTITTEDMDGKTVGFRRQFVLAKSGETVLGDATGSAVVTQVPSPTIHLASPTPMVTGPSSSAPTPTPTFGTVYQPTATPVPPTSGVGGSLPYIFTGVTFIVLGVGVILLL